MLWRSVGQEVRRSGEREGGYIGILFEAAVWGSFMWGWRSIAAEAGRGRCRTLGLVLEKRAEEAHCQSSCYRKSPHSSYSDAGDRDTQRYNHNNSAEQLTK